MPPLGAFERPNDGLATALRDRYQFDLLYYGGLLRYWPQLSPDAASLALAAPARLAAAYPALDPDPAALRAGRQPNPALVASIRHQLGLDQPWYVQYGRYMKNLIFHFDFGFSYQNGVPVRQLIFSRLPASISLAAGAAFLWLVVGIGVGIIAAVRPRTKYRWSEKKIKSGTDMLMKEPAATDCQPSPYWPSIESSV